jgi:hypothetical protein
MKVLGPPKACFAFTGGHSSKSRGDGSKPANMAQGYCAEA